MKVKEESEKVGLKLNIQKTKIITSGPITSWQIDGETVKTERDYFFGGSKITADGDYSHEIKRCLLTFLLCLSLLFFSQLFLSPPQTTILPFCISFSRGWS